MWVLLLVDERGCCRAGGEIRSVVSSVYFGSISSRLRCSMSDVVVVARAALVSDSIVLGRRLSAKGNKGVNDGAGLC